MSSERPGILVPVLLGLTVVTGLIDAVSYLGLGRVFTANMTGNVVFLGFAAAGVQGLSVLRSGAALVAFLLGAVIGGRLSVRMGPGPRHRWAGTAFGLESALLFAAAGVSRAYARGPEIEAGPLYALIGLTGLAMGVRNATVRKLGVPDLTTTVLTLTLTGLASDSTLAGGGGAGCSRRVGSVIAMSAGAAGGAWLVRSGSLALPLAVGAIVSGLGAVFACLWRAEG